MNGLSEILSTFRPISLREMDEVALTNRIDTKFVFHRSLLSDLLVELQRDYAVLDIDQTRIHPYDTIYFDKEDYRLYLDHHNGRGNRYKLRLRQYGSSLVAYVEMKRKTNKGRTEKARKKTTSFSTVLDEQQRLFLHEATGEKHAEWRFSTRVFFERITLVSLSPPERMTLDVGLRFSDDNNERAFPEIIIAEVKQGSKAPSAFIRLMKEKHIHPFSISKYCLGISLLHPELKHNLFKAQHTYLQHLQNLA